jgi:hypothetical protein
MMNVKLLRLKSGEDVIADVTLVDTEDTIILENPAILMPMGGSQGGQVQMGFGPWAPFSDNKKFEIPRDWLVFISTPAKDLLNQYNSMFGSGIVLPDMKAGKQLLT